ncbi:cytoplasmic protein [Alkalihalophilus pseudofirmus]|nr:cytoplasmic protein [Alkalihalophilus pseudofirmus]
MREFIKPKVVVSKCIEFSPCRYNGDKLSDQTVHNLIPFVEFIPICPEVEIGLGTPREVIRLIADGEKNRLVQPKTGQDLTKMMEEFAHAFLEELPDVDGFILKNRSPSCGITDVKVYSGLEKSPTIRTGSGAFTSNVLLAFPHTAIEDEGRLKNFKIREHYLTKLFTTTEFKKIKATQQIDQLNRFHKKNKYLFMAYNQKRLKILGRILSNKEKRPLEELFHYYEEELFKLFGRVPRFTSNINVCHHIFGYFSPHLSGKEKEYFLEMLEKYQEKKIPLSSVVCILKAWAYRFENEYMLDQTFFEPYPEALVEISDSGKGRDYS